MLAGAPFAHEVDFSTGLPTGAVTYSVLGNDNQPIAGLDNVSVTPINGAVSLLIVVPASANTVATPLFETRTLTWSYTTATGVVTDRVRYRVDRDLVFPVSTDGVRAKLGVEPHEVPDDNINLLMAYANLSALYPTGTLDAFAETGDRSTLMVANAIEAMAALILVPSLQLAVAKKESSGTNTFERFTPMDWEMLSGSLMSYVSMLDEIATPTNTDDFSLIFFAVQRTDPLTGTAPS